MTNAATSAQGFEPHVADAIRGGDERIVITGASGWIGRSAIDLLQQSLEDQFDRRVVCFGSDERELFFADGRVIRQRALAEIDLLDPFPTIVLHLAFVTKERAEELDDDVFVGLNRAIDTTVLNCLDSIGATAVFIASSGAAYRAADQDASREMRLYGAMKLEQEERFANWAEVHSRRAVIARIFNVSGPNINKHASYALASFIIAGLEKRPITIRAPHSVLRAYVAVRELLSLVFAMLLDGRTGVTRFDSGGTAMEMAEIAQIVSDVVGPVAIERARLEQTTIDRYVGNTTRYRALLAEHGIEPVSFERQVFETSEFLRFSSTELVSNGMDMDGTAC